MARRGPRCSIAVMLEELKGDDAKAVRVALAGNVAPTDLSRILRANGHRIMPQTIRRHRRDECSCGDPKPVDLEKAGSISGALALLSSGGNA